jgi:putative peptidoglycan lipid II flippase
VTGIISMIIFTSSFNLLLNHLSDLKATEYRARTKNFFMTTVLTIFSVVVPVVIIFLLLNEEIIRIVYMRGNFNTEDVAKTIVPFIWESLSLLNYILYISFTALYLASKKYKALSLIGVPMFLLGILGNFVLSKLFGYFGISISNFIVTLLYALLLIWFSRSFIGSMKKFAVTIIKMLFVSGIVMLIFYIFKESLHLSVNIGAQLYSDLLNTIIYSVLVFSVFNILSYYFRVFYLNSIKVLLWSRYE